LDPRSFSRRQIGFIVGVPVAWAILLLFHPTGEGSDIYNDLEDKVTVFMVVHVGMLVFIPLFGAAVYLLTRGLEGTAAQVSRIGLALFIVFYGAYETLQGIGVGILVNELNGTPSIDEAERVDLVQDFAEHPLPRDGLGVLISIGSIGLVTAMIAAGIALRDRAGAPVSVLVLLVLAGPLITTHPPPYGPTGLVLFVIAVVIFLRSGSPAAAPAVEPGSPQQPP
jgi:hypothetical protein